MADSRPLSRSEVSRKRKSKPKTDPTQALTGYQRAGMHDRPWGVALRKDWRDFVVVCPHCGVEGEVCAHLAWPGDFHCFKCHGGWFQADLVVPAMVRNPEAA